MINLSRIKRTAATDATNKEREALKALAQDLDLHASPRNLVKAALASGRRWRRRERASLRAKYEALAAAYGLYVHAEASKKFAAAIDQARKRAKIPKTAASHLSIVVVKVVLLVDDKTASAYAEALRQASIERIAPNHLAKTLASRGNGIYAMAERFSQSFPKKHKKRDPHRTAVGHSGARGASGTIRLTYQGP